MKCWQPKIITAPIDFYPYYDTAIFNKSGKGYLRLAESSFSFYQLFCPFRNRIRYKAAR